MSLEKEPAFHSMRPEVSQARTSPPRDDIAATALAPLLYSGQMSLGIHRRNSVVRVEGLGLRVEGTRDARSSPPRSSTPTVPAFGVEKRSMAPRVDRSKKVTTSGATGVSESLYWARPICIVKRPLPPSAFRHTDTTCFAFRVSC